MIPAAPPGGPRYDAAVIRLRNGTALRVAQARPGVLEVEVEMDGRRETALAYPGLTGPVSEGDPVVLNTTAIEEGLGTGGYHFVVAVPGRDSDAPAAGHVMKLRYTPLQAKVEAVEEQDSPHHAVLAGAHDLDGMPVVWVPLHSMLGAVAAGARAAGAARIAYVMTDGATLPAAFSAQVAAVREAGLLDAVVSSGQAFGGDLEAVNVFTGLLAARSVAGAEVTVVGDGPGKVGTATPWGATDVSSGLSLNAAAILRARPIAALRVNFADPAYRHHAVSPHSITVLRHVALVPVHVAVPALQDENHRGRVWDALKEARLEERHQLVEVTGEPAVELLRERNVPMATMGRTHHDDPAFFLAAGAAGVLAGRMAAGSAAWRRNREER
jgi:Protein of unknown function (DUF3866)